MVRYNLGKSITMYACHLCKHSDKSKIKVTGNACFIIKFCTECNNILDVKVRKEPFMIAYLSQPMVLPLVLPMIQDNSEQAKLKRLLEKEQKEYIYDCSYTYKCMSDLQINNTTIHDFLYNAIQNNLENKRGN